MTCRGACEPADWKSRVMHANATVSDASDEGQVSILMMAVWAWSAPLALVCWLCFERWLMSECSDGGSEHV